MKAHKPIYIYVIEGPGGCGCGCGRYWGRVRGDPAHSGGSVRLQAGRGGECKYFCTPSNIFREAVAVLLRVEGVRVNARDGEGNTALHYAQLYNYRRVAKLLKKHGATI